MEFDLVEEVRKLRKSRKVKQIRKVLVSAISKLVEEANEKSGYNKALYEELDENKLISDFRMPQVDRIYQPAGKGTTLVVEMPPNCTLAKRLQKEAEYRYMAVFDFTQHELDYAKANPSRIDALQKYLDDYPGLKNSVSIGFNAAGDTIEAPNGVVELDFVVIAPDGKYHLVRFCDEQVGHVCSKLNIAFYQTKK